MINVACPLMPSLILFNQCRFSTNNEVCVRQTTSILVLYACLLSNVIECNSISDINTIEFSGFFKPLLQFNLHPKKIISCFILDYHFDCCFLLVTKRVIISFERQSHDPPESLINCHFVDKWRIFLSRFLQQNQVLLKTLLF